MSYPLKKYSKLEFDTNINQHSLMCIIAGSLERIADSVELMEIKYTELQKDVEKFKRMSTNHKQISNLRGQITKLKNKIEKLKNESK